jgi:hypothetical protein
LRRGYYEAHPAEVGDRARRSGTRYDLVDDPPGGTKCATGQSASAKSSSISAARVAFGVTPRAVLGIEEFTDLIGVLPDHVLAVRAVDYTPATTSTSRPTPYRPRSTGCSPWARRGDP